MNYSALPLLTKILALSAVIIAFVSTLWMLVLGFQKSLVWGLGLLLGAVLPYLPHLAPDRFPPGSILLPILQGVGGVIYLAFLISHWQEARRPFFWSLAAFALMVMAVFSSPDFSAAKMTAAQGSPAERLRSLISPTTPAPGDPANPSVSQPEGAPESAFHSKLPPPTVPPGEKEPPRPGYFYLTQRVSMVTANGIKAANPGEQVILLKRLPHERMLIQVGTTDFEIESSKVTDDLSRAREIEKQDFVARGGRL